MNKCFRGLYTVLLLSLPLILSAQVKLDPLLLPEHSGILDVDETPLVKTPARPLAAILLPPILPKPFQPLRSRPVLAHKKPLQLDSMLWASSSGIEAVDSIPAIPAPQAVLSIANLPSPTEEEGNTQIVLERIAPGQVLLSFEELPTFVASIRLLQPNGRLVYALRTHSGQVDGSLTLAIAENATEYRVELALVNGQSWQKAIPAAP